MEGWSGKCLAPVPQSCQGWTNRGKTARWQCAMVPLPFDCEPWAVRWEPAHRHGLTLDKEVGYQGELG